MLAIDAQTDRDSYIDAYFNNFNPSVNANERAFGPYVYKSMQAKINDVSFPDTFALTDPVEAWHLWVTAFRTKCSKGTSVEAFPDFINGERLMINLDRSPLGQTSGQIISHKFPVRIQMTLNDTLAHKSIVTEVISRILNRHMHAFVEHQRVIMAQNNNHLVLI